MSTGEDAMKLRALATWLDHYDREHHASTGDEVQRDLRRIAGYLAEGAVLPLRSYVALRRDSAKLDALETAGVENWVGYDEAMRHVLTT